MTNQSIQYRLFPSEGTGRLLDLMPQVLEAGLEPALFATVARGKLNNEICNFGRSFTGSAVLYHPNGKVKIGLDRATQQQFWKLVHPTAELHKGGIALPDGFYESARAHRELSREEIAQYNYKSLTKHEAQAHEVYKAEISDSLLRDTYIVEMFRIIKDTVDEDHGMDLWFGDVPIKPIGALWFNWDMNHNFSWSCVHAFIDFTGYIPAIRPTSAIAQPIQPIGNRTATSSHTKPFHSTSTQVQPRSIEEILGESIKTALDAQKPFEYNGLVYLPAPGVKLK